VTSNISVLVIDDEPLARLRLERFINSMPNVELSGSGVDGKQAVTLAQELEPDVVLLDIEMPRADGLHAASKILSTMAEPPAIIFCTAYDQYAVEAFATNAVGYLLKPISFEDLTEALLKARRLTRLQLNQIDKVTNTKSTIKLSQDGYLARLPTSEIIYFRAESKSVIAGLFESEVVVEYTLKTLTETFASEFVRIHRNSLVNKNYFQGLTRRQDGQYELSLLNSDRTFLVSRRHMKDVKILFAK